MAAEQTKKKCAHDGCQCAVDAGQTYCGPHCATASAEPRIGIAEQCHCGHDACRAAAQLPQP